MISFYVFHANNKGADQPAHPRSLISAFVVRCLGSIISLDSNVKTVASFCGCAGRFVSGLVGNSRRHVLSCRGSGTFCLVLNDNHLNFQISHSYVRYTELRALHVNHISTDTFKRTAK